MSSSAIIDRIRSLLDETPPFNLLPDPARKELLTDITIEYFRSGEIIIAQGATQHRGLYIVESGTIRIMDIERQRLIDKCSEGDVFGSYGLMKGGAAIYEAKAIEPSVCAVLKPERYKKISDDHPEFETYFENDVKRYVRHLDREMDVTGEHLLFSNRLNQFDIRSLVTCAPETTAQQAARLMRRESIDSIVIMQGGQMIGILTEGDLRSKVLARGISYETPVRKIMSSPVISVSSDSSLFEAMMLMLSRHINRLVLVREKGPSKREPIGMLTDRDMAHFRGQDPVATVQRIKNAVGVSELVSIRAASNGQLLRLYRQGLQPEMLNRILSVIYDSLAARIVELMEKELKSSMDQRIEVPWSWARVGSGGRQEMALNSQQHNIIIYGNPLTGEERSDTEAWFGALATKVNESLASCGFPMSAYVAKDPRWRKPIREWKKSFREWILQSKGSLLKDAGIFFDLRSIYGDGTLVEDLKNDIIDALNVQAMDPERNFLKILMSNSLDRTPPLSVFRRFQIQKSGEHRNTFDLRDRGVLPVVNSARVLALELRYFDSSNTFDRLHKIAQLLPDLSGTIENVIESYRNLVDFRLEYQLRSFEAGEQMTNRIDPGKLRRAQQNLLRNAFTTIAEYQDLLSRRYEIIPKKR